MSLEENKSRGLGDDVAKLAKKLKLDKVADKVAKAAGKKGCGCKKRQKVLNDLVPYKKK